MNLQHDTDELLSYLYSSSVFQALSENEQSDFITIYHTNSEFKNIITVAKTFQDCIVEIENFIPPATEELKQFFALPRKSILEKVALDQQVVHLTREQFQKKMGPLVVCLQQGDSMSEVAQFCKGMLLSLFDLCHRQNRDLIIIPFANEVKSYQFPYNELAITTFFDFLFSYNEGEAQLYPALKLANELITSASIKKQAEVMIVTNNQIEHQPNEQLNELVAQMKQQEISLSAIAMSEDSFERNALTFIEKVFFVNE